jgi:hypothetical protein
MTLLLTMSLTLLLTLRLITATELCCCFGALPRQNEIEIRHTGDDQSAEWHDLGTLRAWAPPNLYLFSWMIR